MKKILIIFSVAACISAAFFMMTVTSDTKPENGFLLGMIEALAQNESSSGWCSVICPGSPTFVISCDTTPCSVGEWYVECNGSKTYC